MALPLDLSPAETEISWPAETLHFDFDDKLQIYARSNTHGNISIRRIADDVEIHQLTDRKGETWVRLSFDGRFLVSHQLRTVKVWDLQKKSNPPMLSRTSTAFDFHPHQSLLALGLDNGALEIVNLISGTSRKYKIPPSIGGVAWHPRSNRIALGYANGVKIFDLDSEQISASLDVELHSDFRCLAWHPEGSLLALVGSDFRVQIWNLEKGQKARWVVTLEGQGRPGICMAFGHGGSLLATTAWDGFLRLWDARTGQELKRLQWGGYETPRFSTDDRILAARIDDGSMRFWKITIGGEYRTLTRDSAHGPCVPQDGAIGLDGRLLAVGLQDGVGLWDLKTSDFFAMLSSGSIASVAFENSAPPTLLTNGPEGFKRWPLQLDSRLGRIRLGQAETLAQTGNDFQIALSQDHRIIAQAQGFGPSAGLILWQQPKRSISLPQHSDARYITIAPDGQWVATGSHNGQGARIWDTESGKLVKELMPKIGSLDVEFSGDGQWLTTRIWRCQLWKTGTWEKALSFPGTQSRFTPDGKVLAVESGGASFTCMNQGLAGSWRDWKIQIKIRAIGLSLALMGPNSLLSDVKPIRFMPGIFGRFAANSSKWSWTGICLLIRQKDRHGS